MTAWNLEIRNVLDLEKHVAKIYRVKFRESMSFILWPIKKQETDGITISFFVWHFMVH